MPNGTDFPFFKGQGLLVDGAVKIMAVLPRAATQRKGGSAKNFKKVKTNWVVQEDSNETDIGRRSKPVSILKSAYR